MKRYEFTGETKKYVGITLHRIRALRDFESQGILVKAGTLGGWLEGEVNLSQNNTCWVSGEARVFGEAQVSGSAVVFGSAVVYGEARVFGSAQVSGEAQVFGSAVVSGEARVFGSAVVFGEAQVFGEARVFGEAQVFGSAQVSGSAVVFGETRVFGEAVVSKTNDYLCIGPIGSRNSVTTFYRSRSGSIDVVCGCFVGTIAEFIAKVKATYGDNHHAQAYLKAAELAYIQIGGDHHDE